MFKPLIDSFNYFKCNQNYKKKLEELHSRKNTTPIRVCFLVRENQKWSYQSLYELLDKSEDFEPIVLVSLLWLSHIGKDPTRNNLVENYNFFKEKGMNVQYAYENGEYLDLHNFEPDIVFYDQQWDLPKIHQPTSVSEFALTCYVPYGVGLFNLKDDYTSNFHRLLFKFYIENEITYERFKKADNCYIAGNPKFDFYSESISVNEEKLWKKPTCKKIIYAPHHSLDKKGMNLATFKKNGKFILKYAKTHPETTWVFKPHPRLKYALLRNKIMSEDEINKYYDSWQRIGNVIEDGNYFDLFKTSDLMITDCCSFLAEYLPTDKPIIRLTINNKTNFNSLGKLINESCYEVKDNKELEFWLSRLLFRKNMDSKQSLRAVAISNLVDLSKKSSKQIYTNICEELNVGRSKND